MTRTRIEVWSDYVCPFCYLEEPVLARIECELPDAVDPDAPSQTARVLSGAQPYERVRAAVESIAAGGKR